jgi:hypothetical protein
MRPPQQEFAQPREWLIRLAEESDGYRRLVSESHGFGRAAYRLARARCTVNDAGEPCLEDLQAAATLLANCLGTGGALPIRSLLPSARSLPPAAPPPAASQPPARPVLSQTPVPPAPSQRRANSKSRPHATRASV